MPPVHGSPCPGSTRSAEAASRRGNDATAWSASAVNGATCGPRAPVVTAYVANASPTKSAEGGDVKRGAPRSMPGRHDAARAPRHVQGRTVPEGCDLVELRRAKSTSQDREPQE